MSRKLTQKVIDELENAEEDTFDYYDQDGLRLETEAAYQEYVESQEND